MEHCWSSVLLTLCVVCGGLNVCWCQNASYETVDRLMRDLILGNGSGYNSRIRPVNNQYRAVSVRMSASLLNLMQVDDVNQAFTFSALFHFSWMDERLRWDPDLYEKVFFFAMDSKLVWKPQFTMEFSEDMRAFSSDAGEIFVTSSGKMIWSPAGVFKVQCQIDMTKFPFDRQQCSFVLCPVGYTVSFLMLEVVRPDFLSLQSISNEEWEILKGEVTTYNYSTGKDDMSCAPVTLTIKRRPTFMLVNIVFPIVLLSFINILSFVIPVDSGEKISFAITLLLSLSVYMTDVSDLVPRSSKNVPALTIYLFTLFVNSVLSVVVTVIIVYLHRYREQEQRECDVNREKLKEKGNFSNKTTLKSRENKSNSIMPVSIFAHLGERAIHPEKEVHTPYDSVFEYSDYQSDGEIKMRGPDALKFMVDHGNTVSFLFFSGLWTCSTVWYFTYVMS